MPMISDDRVTIIKSTTQLTGRFAWEMFADSQRLSCRLCRTQERRSWPSLPHTKSDFALAAAVFEISFVCCELLRAALQHLTIFHVSVTHTQHHTICPFSSLLLARQRPLRSTSNHPERERRHGARTSMSRKSRMVWKKYGMRLSKGAQLPDIQSRVLIIGQWCHRRERLGRPLHPRLCRRCSDPKEVPEGRQGPQGRRDHRPTLCCRCCFHAQTYGGRDC